MSLFADVYNCGRGADQDDPTLKTIKLFFMTMDEHLELDDLKKFLDESPRIKENKSKEIAAIIKR